MFLFLRETDGLPLLLWPAFAAAGDVRVQVLLYAVAVLKPTAAASAVAVVVVDSVLGHDLLPHLLRVSVCADVADQVVLQLVDVAGRLVHDLYLQKRKKE